MAIGVGVHASAQSSTVSPGAPIATGNVTTTNGSTIIATIACAGGSPVAFDTTPIQDNKGNTWTLIDSELSYSSSSVKARVYKAVNIAGGASHNFTVDGANTNVSAIIVQEITGAGSAPTVSISAAKSDTASPYTSNSVSPSDACGLVGIIWTDAPSGTETDTWGGSFASGDKTEELGNANAGITGSVAAATKAAGTYSTSVTVSGVTVTDSANWIVAVFIPSTTTRGMPFGMRGTAFNGGRTFVGPIVAKVSDLWRRLLARKYGAPSGRNEGLNKC